MAQGQQLDAHQRPPDRMRALFKRYQKLQDSELGIDPDIVDFDEQKQDSISQLRQVGVRSFRNSGSSFEDLSSPSDEEIRHGDCNGSIKAATFSAFEHTTITGQPNCPQLQGYSHTFRALCATPISVSRNADRST